MRQNDRIQRLRPDEPDAAHGPNAELRVGGELITTWERLRESARLAASDPEGMNRSAADLLQFANTLPPTSLPIRCEALALAGGMLMKCGRHEEAIAPLEQALESYVELSTPGQFVHANELKVRIDLAGCYEQLNQTLDAQQTYDAALHRVPGYVNTSHDGATIEIALSICETVGVSGLRLGTPSLTHDALGMMISIVKCPGISVDKIVTEGLQEALSPDLCAPIYSVALTTLRSRGETAGAFIVATRLLEARQEIARNFIGDKSVVDDLLAQAQYAQIRCALAALNAGRNVAAATYIIESLNSIEQVHSAHIGELYRAGLHVIAAFDTNDRGGWIREIYSAGCIAWRKIPYLPPQLRLGWLADTMEHQLDFNGDDEVVKLFEECKAIFDQFTSLDEDSWIGLASRAYVCHGNALLKLVVAAREDAEQHEGEDDLVELLTPARSSLEHGLNLAHQVDFLQKEYLIVAAHVCLGELTLAEDDTNFAEILAHARLAAEGLPKCDAMAPSIRIPFVRDISTLFRSGGDPLAARDTVRQERTFIEEHNLEISATLEALLNLTMALNVSEMLSKLDSDLLLGVDDFASVELSDEILLECNCGLRWLKSVNPPTESNRSLELGLLQIKMMTLDQTGGTLTEDEVARLEFLERYFDLGDSQGDSE